MKKATGVLLSLMMFLSLGSSVIAEDTQGSTIISTYVKPAYTVNIPTSLEIAYNSTEIQELKISVEKAVLETGKMIYVSAKGSGKNDAFTMDKGNSSIAYQVSIADYPWNSIQAGNEIAKFTSDGSSSIYVKVPKWDGKYDAGEHSGNIIFTISYK